MKRKCILVLVVIVILFALGMLCYKIAVEEIKINSKDVSKISIFNGTTGQCVEIIDEGDIEYFINNLNAVQMKRSGVSLLYTGYHYRVTIFKGDGIYIEFIINSANAIRKDPFFYNVEEGEIDVDFIESLFIK
ncbi:MAG: hypothetical protein K2O34_12565 [Acetatifactor sp.]|nr:hypothetical protein [Acetatifactor sp.]